MLPVPFELALYLFPILYAVLTYFLEADANIALEQVEPYLLWMTEAIFIST